MLHKTCWCLRICPCTLPEKRSTLHRIVISFVAVSNWQGLEAVIVKKGPASVPERICVARTSSNLLLLPAAYY